MSYKSIIIDSAYIDEMGWPQSLKGALRIVRKETEKLVHVSSTEGGMRRIPKTKLVYTSIDENTLPDTIEEVRVPSNIISLITAFEAHFGEVFRSPKLLPNKELQVRETQKVWFRDEHILCYALLGVENPIPVFMLQHLPPKPFDATNIDSFCAKFKLTKYREALAHWLTIVKTSASGKFVTKELYRGRVAFSVRKADGRTGAVELVSEFGQFESLDQAEQLLG